MDGGRILPQAIQCAFEQRVALRQKVLWQDLSWHIPNFYQACTSFEMFSRKEGRKKNPTFFNMYVLLSRKSVN